jgi:hypothetical protein
LLDRLPPAKALVADRGYDAKDIVEMLQRLGGGSHPNAARPQGTAIARSRPLSAAQSDRTVLPQAQALQAHCHPLRQARPKLPRRRPHRLIQDLAQGL